MTDNQDPKNTLALRELLVNLDATYRVHTRLYKLNHALYTTALSNLKAVKINSGIYGSIIATILATLGVVIKVFNIDPYSFPIIISFGFTGLATYLVLISLMNASRTEKEFKNIIGQYDEKNSGGIESWFDFTLDELSKLSTRISITKEILRDQTLKPETKELYNAQINYYKKSLEEIKELNEKLYNSKKRSDSEHGDINNLIDKALKMME